MDFLLQLSQLTGISPATLVLIGGLVVTIANALSRVIPDDATGFLAVVRVICKYLGVNVSNRLTSTITVSDIGRALLATQNADPEVTAALKETGALPKPGIAGVTRGPGGKFKKIVDDAELLLDKKVN